MLDFFLIETFFNNFINLKPSDASKTVSHHFSLWPLNSPLKPPQKTVFKQNLFKISFLFKH